MFAPLQFLLRHRSLIAASVGTEVRKRYAGSIVGRGWIIISPLLMLGVYTVVYLYIFRLQPVGISRTSYLFQIFAGLICYLGLAEGIAAGVVSIVSNRTVLRGTTFPAALLPVRGVVSSQWSYVVGMALLVVCSALAGNASWKLLLLPVVMVLQLFFLIGLSWMTSLLSIVIRDMQHAISYVLMMLMILSPIAYTVDMVPRAVSIAVYLNPVAHFVLVSQAAVSLELPLDTFALLGCALLAAVSLVGGYTFFERTRSAFTEYA